MKLNRRRVLQAGAVALAGPVLSFANVAQGGSASGFSAIVIDVRNGEVLYALAHAKKRGLNYYLA